MDIQLAVWDLDSCLADTRPRRHLLPTTNATSSWAKYAHACDGDDYIEQHFFLLKTLFDHGVETAILTGRVESSRSKTRDWLRPALEHRLIDVELVMYPDSRGDTDTLGILDWKLERLKSMVHEREILPGQVLCFDDWRDNVNRYMEAGFKGVWLPPPSEPFTRAAG